ncbi:MAG: SDR family oxidoreductase [Burkholderiaceae bacterium]
MADRLAGKIAVITGAASGIGRETLDLFVNEGARVIAADIQQDVGAELEKQYPGAVRFARCDVTQLTELKAAIDAAAQHFGGLDVLFSNAGRGGSPGGLPEFDPEGWDHTQALLLRSVAAGAFYARPHMNRRGGGSIINTSSVSALQAGYAALAYSVAKAGVLHFTRVAAADLAPEKIRINAIVPGFIATSIFGASMGLGAAETAAMQAAIAEKSGIANPIGRSGAPRDIAEAALFLASDAAGFITGTHLTVDGGLTIGPRHSWDKTAIGPMATAMGLTLEQMQELRARHRRD